jgi:hypothetical protein
MPFAAKTPHPQRDRSTVMRDRLVNQQIPPNHAPDQPFLINVLNMRSPGASSIPKNCDAIGKLKNLLDAMGDVNYPQILFSKTPEYLEEHSSGFIV